MSPTVLVSPGPKAEEAACPPILEEVLAAPNLFAALGLPAKICSVPPRGLQRSDSSGYLAVLVGVATYSWK